MNKKNEILTDVTQMINGAISSFSVLKEEIETIKNFRKEKGKNSSGNVIREDFEFLVKRVDALAVKITKLENSIEVLSASLKKTKTNR